MKIVKEEISRGNYRFYVTEDNGDRVQALEYYLVVNHRFNISTRIWTHLTLYQAEQYRDLVKDLRNRESLVFVKPGNIFTRKTFTYIPILTSDGWNSHKIIYYLKGSRYSRDRHHNDYLTFGNKTACENHFKDQIFEPTKTVIG